MTGTAASSAHTCTEAVEVKCAGSVQPHGSRLLQAVSAPVIRCEIHTIPIQISPRWSPRPRGQGQPATPGLDCGNVLVWQQAGVERVCNHIPQGLVVNSG